MKKILLLSWLIMGIALNAQISLGTGSTEMGNAPINAYYEYSYIQQIFTKQEINADAAGNITGLKFYMDPSASIDSSSDWVVYLGHTSKAKFTSASDWIPLGQLTQVYAGTVTNANGVIEITFATPFPYNNTENLVVAAEDNSPDYDGDEIFSVYGSVQGASLSYDSDTTNPDPSSPPAGDLLAYRSVIALMGLTVNAIPACPYVSYPLNNSIQISALPNITWSAPQGALSYKVSIGTMPGGTDVVNQQPVTATSFTPASPLAPNTDFYLKVTAVGAGGESLGCSDIKFTTLPPPPSNDECVNAIQLTVNPDLNCGSVTAGTTLAATNSGLDPDPCYGTPDDDVWFKFTATADTHVVSLKNIVSVGANNSIDTYFQVFSGSCSGLTNILCSDNNLAVVSALTVGETYYVRVYSYGDEDEGQSFDICVGALPPLTNDECSGAILLTVNSDMNCGSKTTGYTVGATDSGITPCAGEPDDDVWYQFVAAGTSHTVSISNDNVLSGSGDVLFEVFSGACGSLTSIICSDYESLKIVTGLIPGETYYVRVYSEYDGYNSFDLCIGTLPPPPANDACAGALVASVFPYNYTQADAAGATNNDGSITVCSNDMNDGTWFTFTGDGTTFNITVSMPSGSNFDPQIGVYTGSCGNLTCEDTVDDEAGGETETLSIPTVAGTAYYVNIGHYDDVDELEQTFTIAIDKEVLATSEVPKAKDDIKVYPNPFTDVLNVTKADKIKSIFVSDASGRLVKTIENPSSDLHLGDLKQGIYMIMLNMKDGSKQTIKVIKK